MNTAKNKSTSEVNAPVRSAPVAAARLTVVLATALAAGVLDALRITPKSNFPDSDPDSDFKVVAFRRRRTAAAILGSETRRIGLALPGTRQYTDRRTGNERIAPPRVALCGAPLGRLVSVLLTGGTHGRAHFLDTSTCGSWGCPVCTRSIMWRRRAKVAEAVRAWEDASPQHSVAMFTGSMPHKSGQSLSDLLTVLLFAFSYLLGGERWHGQSVKNHRRAVRRWRARVARGDKRGSQTRPVRRLGVKQRFGVAGWIRNTEMPWGARHGWHPHFHILLLLERPLTTAEVDQLRAGILKHFGTGLAKGFVKAGLAVSEKAAPGLSEEHGVHLTVAPRGEAVRLAMYATKPQDSPGTKSHGFADANEPDGLLTHMQMLDASTASAHPYRKQVIEFFSATYNRRLHAWSRGLEKRLASMGADFSDVGLQMAARTISALNLDTAYGLVTPQTRGARVSGRERRLLFAIPRAVYRRLMRNAPERLADVLLLSATGNVNQAMDLCEGINPRTESGVAAGSPS